MAEMRRGRGFCAVWSKAATRPADLGSALAGVLAYPAPRRAFGGPSAFESKSADLTTRDFVASYSLPRDEFPPRGGDTPLDPRRGIATQRIRPKSKSGALRSVIGRRGVWNLRQTCL